MTELWLNFADPDGVTRRVRVDGDRFVIGRQPDCDLPISDSRLSRQHAAIERFGGRYEIADLGSSNGTELRGSPVIDAVAIYDGDSINLGGLFVRAEIAEAVQAAAPTASPVPAATPAMKPAKVKAEKSGGIPLAVLLVAPILAVVLVVVAGGIVYLVVARGPSEIVSNPDDTDDPVITNKKDDDPVKIKTDDTPVTTSTTTTPTGDPVSNSGSTDTPPTKLSENAKIEVNGANFLKKIAEGDQSAFLTTDQAARVATKVKQFSGSSAVADNIKSAQKNASKIGSIANGKKLKPQFLAVAAVAKLGGTRGDVVQAAESMSEVLGKLLVHIGTEFGDDCLLMIAAYDQGAAGETMKMRNMLQNLAVEVNDSSRTIRTIWFLQKQGKITQGEFDRALTFLAIGTITQNPKDFGVNAEALNI